MTKPKLFPKEWGPLGIDEFDVIALQAIAKGVATDAQQRRALEWIIYQASSMYDITYSGENTHRAAMLEGRRIVGKIIVTLLEVKPAAFSKPGAKTPEPKE